MKKNLEKDEGYTLIEVLTAFSLFFLLIFPLHQLISFFYCDSHNLDILNAINLAESEMELAVLKNNFSEISYTTEINRKKYKILRQIKTDRNLVLVEVKIYSLRKNRVIIHFITCCSRKDD